MSAAEASVFLADEVTVEEKVDGANLGIAVDAAGQPVVWNRGTVLHPGSHPQFAPLWGWLAQRAVALGTALGGSLALFGEWCVAVHSARYDRLPDWFLAFDVCDVERDEFWSSDRRDALAARLGLATVPRVARDRFSLPALVERVRWTPTSQIGRAHV